VKSLSLLTVVVPAKDEEGCIAATLEHLHLELTLHKINHEIIVVNDGSADNTEKLVEAVSHKIKEIRHTRNGHSPGFGSAIRTGIEKARGDAIVVMMADESDDCRDVVHYWNTLNEGVDCVFGSRFMTGGGTIGYPAHKYVLNRMGNTFIRLLFGISLNDTTNAFKAYRKTAIERIGPIESKSFELTVELPLKAIRSGCSYKVIPITWRNRKHGISKLKIREVGGAYLSTCLGILSQKRPNE
jgi:dolichol-phosphate mannosyltransferase